MDKYTASNGVEVWIDEDAEITYTAKNAPGPFSARENTQALREFFQAERDEELGRWRWPEQPEYVVYAEDDGVHNVVNENTGLSLMATRGGVKHHDDAHADAARAYFETHPARKPWEDAKPGEVWDVDVEIGGLRAVTVYSARHDEPITVFRDPHTQIEYETDDPKIRDARRIWPESD